MVLDLDGPVAVGARVPRVAAQLLDEARAARRYPHSALRHARAGLADAVHHVVAGLPDLEAGAPHRRDEARGARVDDELRPLGQPVDEGGHVLHVVGVRLLMALVAPAVAVLAHDVPDAPVEAPQQRREGVLRAVVERHGPSGDAPRLWRLLLDCVGVIGINQALSQRPQPLDVPVVKDAGVHALVAVDDRGRQCWVVAHIEVQVQEAQLVGAVDELNLEEVRRVARIAVEPELRSLHRASRDHLVDEALGKERHLVGVAARRREALEGVLAALGVGSEEVVGVRADHDAVLAAVESPRPAEVRELLLHRPHDVSLQRLDRRAGHDEPLATEPALAPQQEAQLHGQRLAGADGALRDHSVEPARLAALCPPRGQEPLLRAETPRHRSPSASMYPLMRSSSRSALLSSTGLTGLA